MLPGRNRFNLFNTPENFVIVLAIMSICDFHDKFSFKFNPRKLKSHTLSIGILSICTGETKPSTFLFKAWNTIYLVFLIFNESLFTANQSCT